MKILAFSDLHRDVDKARRLVELAVSADVIAGAGDFATCRHGLSDVISVLAVIRTPTVLVAGNAETPEELSDACRGWDAAHVLHGQSVRLGGVEFFGLGGAVPITPFGDWSFDLDEAEAARLLVSCPHGAFLVSHSPPLGQCDRDGRGRHLGSRSVLESVESKAPRLVVCGHIHGSWGQRSHVGRSLVVNAGPDGVVLDLEPVPKVPP
jgi:Icc-related predicted phosphoesterase